MRKLVALLAVIASLAACERPETCGARGASTSLTGVVSYAIGNAAGSTMSATLTVFDYIEACTYDDEEFPVMVGGCKLWVKLAQGPEAPSRYFPGNPSGWAEIEGGQLCELPLLDGTALVRVDTGTVAFADETTVFLLTGTAERWTHGSGATGPLAWQFQGAGWPE